MLILCVIVAQLQANPSRTTKTSSSKSAMNFRTRGMDVSSFQKKINWNKVARDSTIKFVYIRATEGKQNKDEYYKTNVSEARKAGLLVGCYHVYSSHPTAYQQMNNMRQVVKKGDLDLIPVLDIESVHEETLYMKRVDKLLELIEREYGVKPMIYTSINIYNKYFNNNKYKGYHFFLGQHSPKPGMDSYTLWQYTDKGCSSGISGDVDLSCFHPDRKLADIMMPKTNQKASI